MCPHDFLQEAERAKGALHGKKALGKRIIVDWARQDQGAAKKNVSSVHWSRDVVCVCVIVSSPQY